MNSKLSIIIPCYNSEKTIELTLQSVFDQDFQEWEALIINDGSTDNTEKIALSWVAKDKRFKYFSKVNEGLGITRNFGIAKAIGEYILPLDSDNLVEKDFATMAIKILDYDDEVGVVHGHAEYFGERNGIWQINEFDLSKILVHNYIDACAIYKRILWIKAGGYDENMPYQGHEDWEFWIAFGQLNVKFHHLNKITFKYNVSSASMIKSFTENMVLTNQDYVVKKHSRLFHRYYSNLYNKNELFYSQLIQNKRSFELIKEVIVRIKKRLWKR
jgi:glycosyltransferase involved in cell wall biosynthesis